MTGIDVSRTWKQRHLWENAAVTEGWARRWISVYSV